MRLHSSLVAKRLLYTAAFLHLSASGDVLFEGIYLVALTLALGVQSLAVRQQLGALRLEGATERGFLGKLKRLQDTDASKPLFEREFQRIKFRRTTRML